MQRIVSRLPKESDVAPSVYPCYSEMDDVPFSFARRADGQRWVEIEMRGRAWKHVGTGAWSKTRYDRERSVQRVSRVRRLSFPRRFNEPIRCSFLAVAGLLRFAHRFSRLVLFLGFSHPFAQPNFDFLAVTSFLNLPLPLVGHGRSSCTILFLRSPFSPTWFSFRHNVVLPRFTPIKYPFCLVAPRRRWI